MNEQIRRSARGTRRDARIGQIEAILRWKIRTIDWSDKQRNQRVVQRRMRAIAQECRRLRCVEYRQSAAICQMIRKRVMPDFVRAFKQWNGEAVNNGQRD